MNTFLAAQSDFPAALGNRAVARTDDKAPYRLIVYVVCTLVAVTINYILGKDMAWDTLNYHFYAGFSALNDRFGVDYFAAGPQSYNNPYVYVPFYLLVKLGLPSVIVSGILAAFHSVILWLTYELAALVCPAKDRNTRLLFGASATILTLMNPILLQQIGSTFSDIITAELALAGWLMLALAIRNPSNRRILFAAILLGTATALKPTNALHAVSGIVALFFLPNPTARKFQSAIYYGLGVAGSFALVAAPWSIRLATNFGNPVFPLMNTIFKSPEFTSEPLRHYRFIPDSIANFLWRPFAMEDSIPMVHEELMAPDIRYALLSILVAIGALIWAIRRLRASSPALPSRTPESLATAAMGFGFLLDWCLWLSGSGNSRYFLPMASIASVVSAALLFKLLSHHAKGRNYLLATLFFAQLTQLYLGTEYRWNSSPWTGRWFNISVPEKLVQEPNLYLSIGMQSNSFIAPFLADGSGLVNFAGGYALGPEGANAQRVNALIARNAPHVRVLLDGEKIYPDDGMQEPKLSQVDDSLSSFGLRVDMQDCETITVDGLQPALQITFESSMPAVKPLKDRSFFVTCHVIADDRDHSAQDAARKAADIILDRLEDSCPLLFQPKRTKTERGGRAWIRRYVNTDLTAWISKGEVKFIQPIRGGKLTIVGRESDWAAGPLHLECGRRDGLFFASVN